MIIPIITQDVCTLFQRNGTKFFAYGDSLRTGVETGLLHNSMHVHIADKLFYNSLNSYRNRSAFSIFLELSLLFITSYYGNE